jgi:phosphoribosylformylglycinamidine synthase
MMSATRTAPQHASTAGLPDAWRVEVFRKPGIDDPAGIQLLAALREIGIDGVAGARSGRGYLLPPTLSRAEIDVVCTELLADPVLDDVRVTAPREPPAPPPDVRRILVARKPGVMDPVALTVQRALWTSGMVPAARGDAFCVATFRAWELAGAPRREGTDARVDALLGEPRVGALLREIGQRILANETIEDLYVQNEALHFVRPAADGRRGVVHVALRDASDGRLLAISRDGALSLSLEEMRAIQVHYRGLEREPTVCELETLAQTWSEHCKHKTFTGIIEFEGERIDNLLKQTIKDATARLNKDWCVSVFHDNAGIIAFDAGFDVCFKVETHNHPSAIDPYGGAGTGVGGVIRDILGVGLGARPIANTDAFFVGPLDLRNEDLPRGCMHPRRILRGVVAGVRDYGNRMGIPTVDGGVWFHPGYVGNPLVYAGTIGLMPHAASRKSVEPGDVILLVGGRTGRDGIHGATFSSVELHEESETLSSAAVQIGDAIAEKRVLDALLVARDRGLYRAITDCGAGGLSSAVGEMGAECGAEVELERVPLKYAGLAPDEIWISEAQERMVLAVPPEKLAECRAAFEAEDVEATPIGLFTATGKLSIRAHGEAIAELDMRFLHEGTPRPVRRASYAPPELADPGCPAPADHAATLLALLAQPDIASKEWIVRQYDHEVQGMSVLKPLVGARMDGPGDAAVLQPLPNSRKGIAVSCAASPRYGALDPAAMAEAVIDEALRNAVAVGGDPDRTAILDNFSWGNCEKPDRLGALVLAARGCQRAALAYGTPFISGKDSLNNEYRVGAATLSIPPTLFISALAILPDVARAVSMDLKRSGSRLYLVGTTRAELGGSHYFELRGLTGGQVPRPDLVQAPRLMRALHAAIARGLALACHDVSEGGLAVAAAEMAFAGALGLDIDLAQVPLEPLKTGCDPDSTRLYSQSCSRFLVEVAEGSATQFEELLGSCPVARIGTVTESRELSFRGSRGSPLLAIDIEELRRAHRGSFHG